MLKKYLEQCKKEFTGESPDGCLVVSPEVIPGLAGYLNLNPDVLNGLNEKKLVRMDWVQGYAKLSPASVCLV